MGTSVSLVAAAAVVLSVLSGFIAFAGWPGADNALSAPPLTLADAPTQTADRRLTETPPPTRTIVLGAPPATPVAASRAQDKQRSPRDRRRDRRPAASPEGEAAADGSVVRPDGQDRTSGSRPRPAGSRNTGGVLREVSRAGGELTRTATRGAGQAVAPVAPGVGQATGDAGRVVGDAVQQVGDKLANTLDSTRR